MSTLLTSDGIKLYYSYTNNNSNKIPIVFVHGFAVNWTCFKKEIEYFKKEGHPVLYFDLRGHGKSEKSKDENNYSFERFSQDINELLKKEHITKKIILTGHSLGGMISIKYSEEHPNKVHKLIIIDSADKAPDNNKLVDKIRKNKTFREAYLFLAKTYHEKKYEKEIDNTKEISERPELFFIKQIFKTDPKAILHLTDTIFQKNKLEAKQIHCPTLILGSNHDELFSEKEEKQLAKKIKHCLIKILPGKHDIIIRKPKLVATEIKQFIHTKNTFFQK